jgi:DNA adenine methylase
MRKNSITNPLKWHGGKHYLAPKIVALMPLHLHFVEPFAGGLSVLFAKNPDGISEVVNDLNADLTNFWDVLKSEENFERMARILAATPFSQVEWERAQNNSNLKDPVTRAASFFTLCRQSMSGRMRDFAPLTRNRTRRRMNEQASAWLGAIDGLAEVHERLRRVVILNRKAEDVIESQDGANTLFYLDPPYVHETRATTIEYGEQEMSAEQHASLLKVVERCVGKVMISMYHHPLYDALLKKKKWKVVEFDLPNNAAGGIRKRRMVECVFMNF